MGGLVAALLVCQQGVKGGKELTGGKARWQGQAGEGRDRKREMVRARATHFFLSRSGMSLFSAFSTITCSAAWAGSSVSVRWFRLGVGRGSLGRGSKSGKGEQGSKSRARGASHGNAAEARDEARGVAFTQRQGGALGERVSAQDDGAWEIERLPGCQVSSCQNGKKQEWGGPRDGEGSRPTHRDPIRVFRADALRLRLTLVCGCGAGEEGGVSSVAGGTNPTLVKRPAKSLGKPELAGIFQRSTPRRRFRWRALAHAIMASDPCSSFPAHAARACARTAHPDSCRM
jgi:hypothetical protein